jgi:hypothetical protein
MTKLFSLAAAAAVVFGAAAPVLAQSANFEAKGFPISLHQAQLTGFADIREASPTPALAAGGMPASPHQLAVLSPRHGDPVKVVEKTGTDGLRIKR